MSAFPDIDQANRAAMMAQYGIVRVPVDKFRYKDWRYSNLGDAIAQAKRVAAAPSKSR